MYKKLWTWIGVSQLLVLLFSIIFYKRIDFLSYTNVSFIIGSILILSSMLGYVMKGRFFDVVFYSFQHVFSRMTDRDRRPLSELVPQKYYLPFITGVVTILLMLCSLFFYKSL
ncbi:DUF3899 domain-containing protein [Virgibacillus alimentarius]|uniref:DUF3899 domain-containing protein n=1 Tax=Virgibacillus alimentarius TaxID=698769 RepID=UPI000A016CE6|nr:DUF3899 domain-containing protein [Virgibacillus sp.]HLR66889.1 DUF3899 domain-containing protein [Virgibacillus sp.]